MAGTVPVIGDALLRFLRGGDEVTGATLSRFYSLHVAVLPAVTTLLLVVHLLLIQRQGMSVPLSVERGLRPGENVPQIPFFPHYVLRDVMAWFIALAGLSALAAFYPWELGVKADAFAPVPPGIRPEWYFMAMFQTLRVLPTRILGLEGEIVGVLLVGVVAMLLLVVPFVDTAASRGHPSRVFTAAAWIGLAWFVSMTVAGYISSR
jgi:quinol-cytochrome oxidoreductase complex cytochrome b subunit